MRLVIYGTLALLSSILVWDTNYGTPVVPGEHAMVHRAANYLQQKHFTEDAQIITSILDSNGFRRSRFYSTVFRITGNEPESYSYYAYTPVLSRSKIFLGDSLNGLGVIGSSSILIHECAHIRRHREYFLGGFPRGLDEAMAYRRQYSTYRSLRLSPVGPDGIVYWDMMLGIQQYVIPRFSAYADRPDIQEALRQFARLE